MPTQPESIIPLTIDAAPAHTAQPPWQKVLLRARKRASLAAAVLVFAIGITGAIYYVTSHKKQATTGPTIVNGQALTSSQIQKLADNNISVGPSAQALTFQTPSTFKSDVNIKGDTTLTNLTVTGTITYVGQKTASAFGGGSQLQGNLGTKGSLSVDGNITAGGNLTVLGNASFGGSIAVGSLSAKNASFTNLSFAGHFITGGSTPTAVPGNGVGSVSIDGNDTSGTIIINTSSGAQVGALATINFKTAFSATPHVIITPVGEPAAKLQYYINRSVALFTIQTGSAPDPNTQYVYDYIVAQ